MWDWNSMGKPPLSFPPSTIKRRLVLLRGVVWGFFIVFSPLLQFIFLHVRILSWDEFSKLRGRKGNGRRGKDYEKRKGERKLNNGLSHLPQSESPGK